MIISEWENSEEEKNEILDLSMKAFGKCELTNPDYFDWQYQQNPKGNSVIITVKDENKNNAIVGVNAFVPMEFILNKKQVNCYLSCNSIINPDYRGKGIFTQLISKIPEIFSTKDFSIIYGIPNKNSTKIFSKNQFLEISKLPLLIKPLNLSSYFKSPISKIIKPFDVFWKPKNLMTSDIQLLDKSFSVEFEDLIKKSLHRLPIFQFRTKEFLQWRYMNHPTRNYQILTLRNATKLVGYIITREMQIFSKKVGIIVDFLVDPNIEQQIIFQKLIKTALFNFWKNKISIVISTSKNGNLENEILTKSGFFKAPSFLKQEQLPLIISTFNNNFENFENFDDWFFTLGDYDVF
jgi:hypothetical protein